MRYLLIFCLFLFNIIGTSYSSQIKRITLEDLEKMADVIVMAQVQRVQSIENNDMITIGIDKILKGRLKTDTITISFVTRGGLKDFDPTLQKGDCGVFFLKKIENGFEKAYFGGVATFSKNHFFKTKSRVKKKSRKFIPDPSRWKQPRFFHTEFDKKWLRHIQVSHGGPPEALLQPIHSPNKGYYFMILRPNYSKKGEKSTKLFIYNENEKLIHINIVNHYANYQPKIKWISEKLLMIRIWWGRLLGSELIFDVEQEKWVYQEMIQDGKILFQQYKDSI